MTIPTKKSAEEKRQKIISVLSDYKKEGLWFNELKRLTKLSVGTLLYHLDKLIIDGLVEKKETIGQGIGRAAMVRYYLK